MSRRCSRTPPHCRGTHTPGRWPDMAVGVCVTCSVPDCPSVFTKRGALNASAARLAAEGQGWRFTLAEGDVCPDPGHADLPTSLRDRFEWHAGDPVYTGSPP